MSTTTVSPGETLTPSHAAQRLKVSKRKFWDHVNDQDDPLPVVRLGRRTVRVLESDLVKWLERHRDDRGSEVDRIVDEVLKS